MGAMGQAEPRYTTSGGQLMSAAWGMGHPGRISRPGWTPLIDRHARTAHTRHKVSLETHRQTSGETRQPRQGRAYEASSATCLAPTFVLHLSSSPPFQSVAIFQRHHTRATSSWTDALTGHRSQGQRQHGKDDARILVTVKPMS